MEYLLGMTGTPGELSLQILGSSETNTLRPGLVGVGSRIPGTNNHFPSKSCCNPTKSRHEYIFKPSCSHVRFDAPLLSSLVPTAIISQIVRRGPSE